MPISTRPGAMEFLDIVSFLSGHFFFFFGLLPLSLRHFRRMSPSVLIRTRAVSDVEVAGRRVKTSVSLRRATCRGGHVEAVFLRRQQDEPNTLWNGDGVRKNLVCEGVRVRDS